MRAFVHSDDARAAELKDLGAEIVLGDLREIQSVTPALQGVRRAYFTYPVTAGMLDAAAVFAAVGQQSGLERVVAVSQLGSDPQAGTPHMRRHWVAEQALDRAGIGAVHLRAAVFFENLRVAIGDTGVLALPLGSPDTVLPLIAGADVAGVGSGVLRTDGPVDPVLWLAGEIMTVGEAAEILGVPYVPVDAGSGRGPRSTSTATRSPSNTSPTCGPCSPPSDPVTSCSASPNPSNSSPAARRSLCASSLLRGEEVL